MSFKLKPNESLRKGLRRIIRKQIDGALKVLTAARRKARDEAVHEARKSIKKVRAVLRLIRPEIGSGTYRKANTALRDTARPLTEVRDAKILIETTTNLAEHFKDRVAGRTFTALHDALRTEARAVRKRVLNQGHAFANVKRALRAAQSHVEEWTHVPNKWSSIGDGLCDTYDRASDAFNLAADDPQIEKLHEWRKQAKYLRYQLEILRPLWPERIEELANEADSMAELLGSDHDLALLRQTLTGDRERFGDATDVELLLALIEHRQTELRQQAVLLGRRFFVESPAGFTRQLKGYWRTWRDQSDSQQSGELQAALA
jgi:CHAD domain-containing protein